MTKGTRVFRIIICMLLGLTILWTAFISYAFIYVTKENEANKRNERYGIQIAGMNITAGNAHDVLGDGTVSYNDFTNVLTLKNATIECEGSAIYSQIDLTIELVGENKFICHGKELIYALYASNISLKKDLAIRGDGSLEIVVDEETSRISAGIIADDLWIGADVSVTVGNATESTHGISCGYLNLSEGTALTVQVGAAETSAGISVRENMYLNENTVLDVMGAASTEESWGIECDGVITAKENATICAESGSDRAGIVCYGAFLNYGARIESEIACIDGLQIMNAD